MFIQIIDKTWFHVVNKKCSIWLPIRVSSEISSFLPWGKTRTLSYACRLRNSPGFWLELVNTSSNSGHASSWFFWKEFNQSLGLFCDMTWFHCSSLFANTILVTRVGVGNKHIQVCNHWGINHSHLHPSRVQL